MFLDREKIVVHFDAQIVENQNNVLSIRNWGTFIYFKKLKNKPKMSFCICQKLALFSFFFGDF